MKRTTKDMRPRGYTAVQLRRVDKARNMARFCCLAVQQNLFGVWWFVREFGRIGSPGRVMQPPTLPCTISRTGGGSAFFASLTRRHLFPWEDGSPR
jgi:hypothetical protein